MPTFEENAERQVNPIELAREHGLRDMQAKIITWLENKKRPLGRDMVSDEKAQVIAAELKRGDHLKVTEAKE